jgi:hypothetical protein
MFAAVALAGLAFTGLGGVSLEPLTATANPSIASPLTGDQIIAVAFDVAGNLLAQARDPARLFVVPATNNVVTGAAGQTAEISLSSTSRDDTGHDIFHVQAGGLVACASCHPEGGDDGHVWLLDNLPRRTPSLRGTIAGTAPYHWPGDEADIPTLLGQVYTHRMSGPQLDADQQGAVSSWVESIPAPPAPTWVDSASALRGKALFESASTGCSGCHAGAKLTNNMTVNVGTGTDQGPTPDGSIPPVAFQVPPLVGVGWRTPLLHNGCAVTIADRFGKCATAAHGQTSMLSAANVAYLESL